MNGEIPSVPITTLAGVTSLTDLLAEIPLPTPLPHTVNNTSLLHNPSISDDASRLLDQADPVLAAQLHAALQQTSADNIELNDGLASDGIDGDVPELLKAILSRDPTLFQSKKPAVIQNDRTLENPVQLSQPFLPQVTADRAHSSQPIAASTFQAAPSFSPQVSAPLINGGSPSTSQMSQYPAHSSRRSNKATVSSPAQASSAPATQHPAAHRSGQTTVASTRHSSRHHKQSRHEHKAEKGMAMFPTLKLTRVEDLMPPAENKSKNKNSPFVMVRSEDGESRFIRNRHYDSRKDSRRHRSDRDKGGSLSDRVKRKKRHSSYKETFESDSDMDEKPQSPRAKYDSSDDECSSRRSKKMKRSRQRQTLTTEELLDSAVFKRFITILDSILENAGDASMNIHSDDEDEYHESTITRSTLSDLCSESAKLKSLGVTNQIPRKKLVRLLTILQLNIKDGCRAIPLTNQDDSDDENETDSFRREMAIERVVIAVDASLTALNIMTAPDMPKQVYIEDTIERLVLMVKAQLQNYIYPEFDIFYRVNNKHGSKSRRGKSHAAADKTTVMLYNRLSEVVGTFAQLVDVQELTDTIVLQASTLAVTPFFVGNVSELQLNALKLVTSIFNRYEKHRQLIMEDILSSLARLPTAKKNLRNYRLNSEENIQMVTALLLELIQCVVKLPAPPESELPEGQEKSEQKTQHDNMDAELTILTSYDTAMRTAHNFLSVFLRKCAIKGEEDYRPLFENFVYDLLSTVNKPEWPAAEVLLSILGRLLVQQFSNKSVDMSMRVTSLEYLGIVAARLRKDAINSRLSEDVISEIITTIHDSDAEDVTTNADNEQSDSDEKTARLQKALLHYLVYYSENDPALVFSRQFYIAQWYKDCNIEVEKAKTKKKPSKKSSHSNRHQKRRGRRRGESSSEESSSEEESDDEEESEDKVAEELEQLKVVQAIVEERKLFLIEQVNSKVAAFTKYKPSPSKLDYENACLVSRYLAANRPFSQSFDIYLTQILKVLCETAIAVRTKAMKCLTAVVEADPAILARADMQHGVYARLLDQSISVREASVDLLGKFILVRPDLTAQYYDMLSARILDTGTSVRKRVIKIFRDICLEQPDFNKIPEMCVKMIRRVNDEEGIQKLVNDTFHTMWFTPVSSRDPKKLLIKVMNIIDVVAAFKDTGQEWFEHLLQNLLKKESEKGLKHCEKSCEQIINCLVENVLTIEESEVEQLSEGRQMIGGNQRLVSCFATLYMFCKVSPQFMVPHIQTIQPYLNIRCANQRDFVVLYNVAHILEQSVPLMDHPGEGFLVQLEEDMMKLVLRHGMLVVQSCISCLGALVNNVTHNYNLIRDCFRKFFGMLSKIMEIHKNDSNNPALAGRRSVLLRSLFSVGLLCKHFNFDSEMFGETNTSIKDRVFDVFMYFLHHADEEVRVKSLTGIGHFCVRHYDYMLTESLKEFYHELLSDPGTSTRMKCQVLKNINVYLIEEERRMTEANAEWSKSHETEDIKELGDVQSGMASTMIQVYIKQVLESFFHTHHTVRTETLSVVCLILNQGLVHPVHCVPYLVCMGTDCDTSIRSKADQQLKEIDVRYPGFIQMKAMAGVKMSYRLQEILQLTGGTVRGVRLDEIPISLNHYIYSLIRNSRNYRRALLSNTLNMFDDTAKTPLPTLLYMADNMAYFPYMCQDEPLYIIHQVDILVSVSGANLLQSFHELFYPDRNSGAGKKFDDDEDDAVDVLMETLCTIAERTPANIKQVQELYMMSQGCVLLLNLKQYLKEAYGFTDAKISLYSPTEAAKVYDKPLNRRPTARFVPKQVIQVINSGEPPDELDDKAKKQLILAYLDFKELMLSIDPDDNEEEGAEGGAAPRPKPLPNPRLKQLSAVSADAGAKGAQYNPSVDMPPFLIERIRKQQDEEKARILASQPVISPSKLDHQKDMEYENQDNGYTDSPMHPELLPDPTLEHPTEPVLNHIDHHNSHHNAHGGGSSSSHHHRHHKHHKSSRRHSSSSHPSSSSSSHLPSSNETHQQHPPQPPPPPHVQEDNVLNTNPNALPLMAQQDSIPATAQGTIPTIPTMVPQGAMMHHNSTPAPSSQDPTLQQNPHHNPHHPAFQPLMNNMQDVYNSEPHRTCIEEPNVPLHEPNAPDPGHAMYLPMHNNTHVTMNDTENDTDHVQNPIMTSSHDPIMPTVNDLGRTTTYEPVHHGASNNSTVQSYGDSNHYVSNHTTPAPTAPATPASTSNGPVSVIDSNEHTPVHTPAHTPTTPVTDNDSRSHTPITLKLSLKNHQNWSTKKNKSSHHHKSKHKHKHKKKKKKTHYYSDTEEESGEETAGSDPDWN